MSYKSRRISLLVIRSILGLVFLLSGIGKLIDSGYVNYDLVRLLSTKFFWIIEYAAAIVITISIIELVIALWLFWGLKVKGALAGAAVMLLIFSTILGYFYLQGMNVASCGCFGALGIGGGFEFSLIKNAVLLILIIAAFFLMTPGEKKNVDLQH